MERENRLLTSPKLGWTLASRGRLTQVTRLVRLEPAPDSPCRSREARQRLRVMLIQIEQGIKLRLLRQEIFKAGLVLEGPAQLRPVIGKGLLMAFEFVAIILGAAVKAAQDMLDALNCAERIFGVEIGLVDRLAPDEELGLAGLSGRCPGLEFRSL